MKDAISEMKGTGEMSPTIAPDYILSMGKKNRQGQADSLS